MGDQRWAISTDDCRRFRGPAGDGLPSSETRGRAPGLSHRAAEHWFDRRMIGMLLRSAGAIPMNRNDPAVHLEGARRVLDAGIPILVTPEGVLSGEPRDPTSLGRFKTGAARPAYHSNAGMPRPTPNGTASGWSSSSMRRSGSTTMSAS
jgi:hypothetical protein